MGRLAVRDFEDWFVQASWNADLWASPELRDAVYSIELVLAEYSNRHVSNSYMRAFAGDLDRFGLYLSRYCKNAIGQQLGLLRLQRRARVDLPFRRCHLHIARKDHGDRGPSRSVRSLEYAKAAEFHNLQYRKQNWRFRAHPTPGMELARSKSQPLAYQRIEVGLAQAKQVRSFHGRNTS